MVRKTGFGGKFSQRCSGKTACSISPTPQSTVEPVSTRIEPGPTSVPPEGAAVPPDAAPVQPVSTRVEHRETPFQPVSAPENNMS